MKKTTITLSYDEEKLSALKLYLGQKETQIEDELVKALDTLYTKSVPAGVREFLEMKVDGVSKPPAPIRKQKISSVADENTEAKATPGDRDRP